MLSSLDGEFLAPVEHLQERFNELYDRVETLKSDLDQRHDVEGGELSGMLAVAEAEMKAALYDLRAARP